MALLSWLSYQGATSNQLTEMLSESEHFRIVSCNDTDEQVSRKQDLSDAGYSVYILA